MVRKFIQMVLGAAEIASLYKESGDVEAVRKRVFELL